MGGPDMKTGELTLRVTGDMGLVLDETEAAEVKGNMRTADMDQAIEATTFGRFHVVLGCIGGMFYLSTGLEFGLLGYVLPFAQCDLDIGSSEVGFITSLFMAGAIVCALFWGLIADTFGRRYVLILTLGIDGVCSILASWSGSYVMFAVVRLVNGLMCGAPGAIGPSYIGEFFPDKHRARALCIIGFCWSVSWLILPALSWLVIPADITFSTSYITYSSWRFLVALIGIPNIISAILIWAFLTESPKFLYYHGYDKEAHAVLRMMFAKNTGRSQEEYPISKIVEEIKNGNAGNINSSDNSNQVGKIRIMLSAMTRQITQLFTKQLLGRTALSALIYCSNFMGYYGFLLWLPELYNRFEDFYVQNPNGTAAVCELSYLRQNTTSGLDQNVEFTPRDCEDANVVNIAVFSNTFIMGAACCVSNVIVTIMSNKVDGRLITASLMGLGGLSVGAIYFIRSSTQIVIVSTLFGVCVNSSLLIVCYLVVNLFPTSVRSMAVSFAILSGRLGAVISNLMFGLLIDTYCELPMFISAASMIVGALIAFLFPKEGQKATE